MGESENGVFEREKVIRIINSVIDQVEKVEDLSREELYKELVGLQGIINEARAELRQANAGDINQTHIPDATDELDAVVKTAEAATMTIFNACEEMEKLTGGMDPAAAGGIQNQVVRIYEACSFQDITGQRITKVVKSLRQIEEKVGKVLNVLHDRMGDMELHHTSKDERTGDAALLNGPALPSHGINQDDIDKLLASFD